MPTVDLQLDRGYVSAGNVVQATGGPYTVADNGKITIDDSNEAAVRSDLGSLVVGGTPKVVPVPFAASKAGLDVQNTTTKQAIFTVPAGRKAVVTEIVLRNPSGALSDVGSVGFGFDADATDAVTAAPVSGALGTDEAITFLSTGGLGASASVFGVKWTIAAGSAETISADVVGYYV